MTLNINIISSGSKGNCLHLSDGETQLLLDCGVSLKKIQQGVDFKLSEIDSCLVTHQHLDHCKSVSKLQKYGINTYMSKETAEAINSNSHRTKIVKPLTYTYIGSWSVLPFPVKHDVPNMGYMLESKYGLKVLYAVDTQYIKYRFKNLTHIMLGVNYEPQAARSDNQAKYKHVLEGHMSLETAVNFIKANRSPALEAIYLLHLSDRNSDERRFKKEIQKVSGVPVYIGDNQ